MNVLYFFFLSNGINLRTSTKLIYSQRLRHFLDDGTTIEKTINSYFRLCRAQERFESTEQRGGYTMMMMMLIVTNDCSGKYKWAHSK